MKEKSKKKVELWAKPSMTILTDGQVVVFDESPEVIEIMRNRYAVEQNKCYNRVFAENPQKFIENHKHLFNAD